MKNLIGFIVCAVFSLNASAYLSVEEPSFIETALLLEIDYISDQIPGVTEIQSGSIFINHTTDVATLTVQPEWSCPHDTSCATVMPEEKAVALPIISVENDACNVITYVAQKGQPTDSLRRTLKIVDYSKAKCDIAYPNETEITFTTSYYYGTPGQVDALNLISTFTASTLHKLRSPHGGSARPSVSDM